MTATKTTEPTSPPLLSLSDVVAGYGAGDILKGVSLKVWQGQVMCLIGPNGAGKSTVLKCISGLLRPKAGAVTFAGKDVTATSPRAKLGLGLVHVPQDRSLFPHMTVWDNLLMGGYSVRDHHAVKGRIEEAIAMFPILARRRHAHAGALSGGEQKQVELARTLLLNPHLIMLDEPSIGLDPKSRKLVFEAIGTLAASGRTVLLVEQNARSGLAASHVGAVLEAGVVRLVRAADELLTDPDVARLYLGGTPQPPSEARPRESASSGLPEPAGEAVLPGRRAAAARTLTTHRGCLRAAGKPPLVRKKIIIPNGQGAAVGTRLNLAPGGSRAESTAPC